MLFGFLIVALCSKCVMPLLDGNFPAVSELMTVVQQLNKTLDASRVEVHNLKSKVDNITIENLNLKSGWQNLEAQVRNLTEENIKLHTEVEKYSGDLRNINTTLYTRPVIAFTAVRIHDIDNMGEHQTLEFDKVITNIGNAYDPRHGHFVVPVKGVYHFTVTVSGWSGESILFNMVKNGNVLCSAFSVKADDATEGSCAVTIESEYNDMVWVRFDGQKYGSRVYGSNRNVFSGFLVTKI